MLCTKSLANEQGLGVRETTSLVREKVRHSACLSALSEECELCLAYSRGVRPMVAHGFEQLFFIL